MRWTPFVHKQALEFLQEQGIIISDNEFTSDVFIAERLSSLRRLRIKYGPLKNYLIWTREPRNNTHFGNKIKGLFWNPEVHIMNVYTSDVFVNNYYENSYVRVIDRLLEPLNKVNFSSFRNRKIAALMICRSDQNTWSLKRGNEELDLCYLRTKIALDGHNLGKIDIYGQGWPDGISIENSRWENRKERKEEILRNYHFNLCFENTNTDYYCTEKIWDSIKYGCLPIYYGEGNKIYEDFPKNSFLDYCEFESSEALFKYIDQMTVEEFRNRQNLCIEVFNKICKKFDFHKPYEETVINPGMLTRIVQKIKRILKK